MVIPFVKDELQRKCNLILVSCILYQPKHALFLIINYKISGVRYFVPTSKLSRTLFLYAHTSFNFLNLAAFNFVIRDQYSILSKQVKVTNVSNNDLHRSYDSNDKASFYNKVLTNKF